MILDVLGVAEITESRGQTLKKVYISRKRHMSSEDVITRIRRKAEKNTV